jgi:hypothetical protein
MAVKEAGRLHVQKKRRCTMKTAQKQTEEMIAAMADTTLPPEKVAELAATLLHALGKPANVPDDSSSSDQAPAQIEE